MDIKNKHVHCTCESFHYNELKNQPFCKHTKEYRELIYKTLYGSDIKIMQGMIRSFKTVKSKVRDVLKDYPELIGENYEHIFSKTIERYPELKGKKTTIERAYRKLVQDAKDGSKEDIMIPVDVELRTRKQESVMHDINHWDPSFKSGIGYNQTALTEEY